MYHIVCPTKYRRAIFASEVDAKLKEVCTEIQKRYEITFLKIGSDDDHIHFLVQSVPMYSPKQLVQIIKSITVREILKSARKLRNTYGAASFGLTDMRVSTVGAHGNEQMIKNYVEQQGKTDENGQLRLF